VRQLAAALPSCELARRLGKTLSIPGPVHGQQAGLSKSGSKLPHSRALRGWRRHRFEAVKELAEASIWIFVRVSPCFAEQ